jgi:hypothetical protein
MRVLTDPIHSRLPGATERRLAAVPRKYPVDRHLDIRGPKTLKLWTYDAGEPVNRRWLLRMAWSTSDQAPNLGAVDLGHWQTAGSTGRRRCGRILGGGA